jgi:hypothetical protein
MIRKRYIWASLSSKRYLIFNFLFSGVRRNTKKPKCLQEAQNQSKGKTYFWHVLISTLFIHIAIGFMIRKHFVFCLSSSCVLCAICFQYLWIAHSWLPLRVSLTFIFTYLSIQMWKGTILLIVFRENIFDKCIFSIIYSTDK